MSAAYFFLMDQLNLIQNRLKKELGEMNSIIHQSLYTPNELMNQVVTNYLTVKGKQIRPIMVILSAALFGNVNEHVLHAAPPLKCFTTLR